MKSIWNLDPRIGFLITALLGLFSLSLQAKAQTGKYVSEFFENVKKNGPDNTSANQADFDRALNGATNSMMQRTTNLFAEEYRNMAPIEKRAQGNTDKAKGSKNKSTKSNETPHPPSSSEPSFYQPSTSRGSRASRDTDTGMVAGSEAGAQEVTFTKPSDDPKPQAAPSAASKFRK